MYTASMRKPRAAELGVTFVELVFFIVIVSIAVAGVLLVMNNTTRHSADPQLRKQALAIAEGLLEEVELAHFTYCDPADPQAPYATNAVVGPMGAGGPSSAGGAGGCSTAALVENVGPEAGNVRPFDNVNDYVTALGTAQPFTITDVNGTAVTGLSGTYTATLAISKATLPGMTADPGVNATLGSALLITVAVTYQGGVVTLDGYRTQYAPQVMP